MSSILNEYDEEETLAYIAEEQYGLGHAAGHAAGHVAGLAERDVDLVRKNSMRLSATQLAELMGKEVTYIEEIVELIESYPEEENEELVKRMLEEIERKGCCV